LKKQGITDPKLEQVRALLFDEAHQKAGLFS
jgi:hypothetical protein